MNSASLRRTTVGKTLLLCVALAVLFALVYVARDGLAPPTVVSKSDSAQIIAPPVPQPLPPAPAHYRVNGAANLSPPRDASPLRVSPGKPLARKDMKCWDHLSRPTAAPSWADSLFRAIGDTGTYNALRDAVEQDPWTILLAWVPAYMWTVGYRERNHTGLLQDYNASWHYAPPDQRQRALPIVYQLGHRNALAVCARERINLLARRCSVDGLPPILVHSCLCPECEESLEGEPAHQDRLPGHATADAGAFAFLPAATQRLPAVQKYRSTAPRVPPAKAPVPPAGWSPHDPKCVSAFCAPWLVSRDVVPAFSYEGLSSDLPTLLSRVADVNGDVMVVLFNAAWVDHVYNWVFSMCHRAGQMRPRYIVATMDAPSLELCISLRLPCFDVVPFMYNTEAGADGDSHKRKVSNTIGWIKPRLALEILDLGYGFWMADLDMTWNRAPDAYMPPMEPNLLMHQCDQPVRLQLNSGFYLVRPSLAAWLYFTNMMTFSPEEMNDQNAMRFWTRSDRTHQLRTKCLDSRVFDMKCNYIVPHSRVPAADGKSLLRWSPIERDRTKFTWSIHHGTCLDGSDAKIKYFRTMNMWFVDDLDAMTVPGQPFCWRVGEPGAEKRVNVTLGATSKHSPMYPTGGDQKYLLEMH